MKRILLCLIALLLAASVLTACEPDSQGEGGTTTTPTVTTTPTTPGGNTGGGPSGGVGGGNEDGLEFPQLPIA